MLGRLHCVSTTPGALSGFINTSSRFPRVRPAILLFLQPLSSWVFAVAGAVTVTVAVAVAVCAQLLCAHLPAVLNTKPSTIAASPQKTSSPRAQPAPRIP